LRARHRLTARGHDALRDTFGEAGFDRRQALGDDRHALGDQLPVVRRLTGHEVEHHAHRLHRAAQHAEVAQALAGIVLLEREHKALAQHFGGDPVGVGLDRGRVQGPQGCPVELGPLVAAGR